ncbi:hypothetical protein Tco_1433374 [Tanacetum coccineum]
MIVKDLMTSFGKRYKRLKKISGELRIQFSAIEVSLKVFLLSMVIEEPEYGIFFTDVFVMASIIKTPQNARFSLKLKKLIVEHPDQEKLQSKKVKLEAVRAEVDKKGGSYAAIAPKLESGKFDKWKKRML